MMRKGGIVIFHKRLKKIHKSKGDKVTYSIRKFIFSLLLAVVAYIGLINIEKSMLNDYKHCSLLRAKCSIDSNTEFTKDNIKKYFYLDEIPARLKSDDTLDSYDNLIGTISSSSFQEGEIISKARLLKKSDILKDIKNPVEVSFEAADLSQVVGGIIRQGDIIQISVVNSTKRTTTNVLDYAYVEKVFDTNGQSIDKTQKESSAVILNIVIDRDEVKEFNEKIILGEVRVSKINKFKL